MVMDDRLNNTATTVGAARAAAADWVERHAGREEWFRGAYYSGSTVGQPDEAALPASSDIDVVVVSGQDKPPLKPGKIAYRGALIEVTYLSWSELASVRDVLVSYHLAGSFRTDTIIADPTGHLCELQAQVALHFAEAEWVRLRCGNVRQKIENGLRSLDAAAPLHDRITSWLFPTGVTTHVLLVAALRNPTVRLRYLAARETLEAYGQTHIYPKLLELLGCGQWTPQMTRHHLNGLARTFDAAAAEAKTPFFFSSDITAAARPIAIDGSAALIHAGRHREAVFWIVATYARCHKILAADAPPEVQRENLPLFQDVIDDLGVGSTDALMRRAGDVIRFLPELWKTAETIMKASTGGASGRP